jgi:hypothetical protein
VASQKLEQQFVAALLRTGLLLLFLELCCCLLSPLRKCAAELLPAGTSQVLQVAKNIHGATDNMAKPASVPQDNRHSRLAA